jgi:hypothetical protein
MWSIRSGYKTMVICNTFTFYYFCLTLIKNVIGWQYFVKFSHNNIYEIRLVRVVICVQKEWLLKERTQDRVFVLLFSAETTKLYYICMYLLTSSVCTYWHHPILDPIYHSLRQHSFLLIFSHYKSYPFFPILFIAITLIAEFLLNLVISPNCYTATSNFCHSKWHPIFHFHTFVALTCLL